jgi:hypothetical protein
VATAQQYFDAAQERLTFLEAQKAQLEAADQSYARDATRADELWQRSWRELGGYLLPEVDDQVLADLERRLTYPGLMPIRDDFRARVAAAKAREAELSGLEAVMHTDILVANVEDELQEIDAPAKAFQAELDGWRASPWLAKLDARGYFTADYKPGFLSRFGDWRAVSFLMRDLEKNPQLKFADPEALKSHFRTLETESGSVFALHRRLTDKRAEVQGLRTEYEQMQAAPATLNREMYVALAEALRDHLESTPVDLRFELARGDAHMVTFFKKLDGLDKKRQYLSELRVLRIQRHVEELAQQLHKLRAKVSKRRDKRRRGRFRNVSDAEIASLRRLKADKWQRRHDKLEKVRLRLDDFEDYDRGSIGEHVLWWDVMTRGAPGDDLYTVRAFHEQWGGPVAEAHPHAPIEASLAGGMQADAASALAMDMTRDEAADDWGLDAS